MLKTMMIIVAISVLLFSAAGSVVAQTQQEMNQKAVNNYKKADKELNNTYKQILKEYAADSVFIKNLKVSQNIWVKFRDAEVKMKYPDDDYAGTATQMCKAQLMEQITKSRKKTLGVWLTGIMEGDACMGTVKVKSQ
jgi:uncharacterized protein YecT (DUF1311 family)